MKNKIFSKKFAKINVCMIIFFILSLTSYAASSYTVAPGQAVQICEFSVCRQVTNSGSKTLFIPTNTAAEWSSFYNHLPASTSACDPNAITSCSGWGSCSTTCGWGTQYRTCTNACGGSVQQSQDCYDGSSIGQVSSCNGWGSCSTTCGPGTKYRTCYYTCGGSYTDSTGCNNGACGPTCGAWSQGYAHPWANWFSVANMDLGSCASYCASQGGQCCEWYAVDSSCWPEYGNCDYACCYGDWYANSCG